MAAATAVTRKAGFHVVAAGECTLDPGSVATGANEDQTIAVEEAAIGDIAIVAPRAVLADGMIVSAPHVSADGTITFTIENTSAGTVDEASQTWDWMLLRGNLGIPYAG